MCGRVKSTVKIQNGKGCMADSSSTGSGGDAAAAAPAERKPRVEPPPGMSRNAFKRQLRDAKWDAGKDGRRCARACAMVGARPMNRAADGFAPAHREKRKMKEAAAKERKKAKIASGEAGAAAAAAAAAFWQRPRRCLAHHVHSPLWGLGGSRHARRQAPAHGGSRGAADPRVH